MGYGTPHARTPLLRHMWLMQPGKRGWLQARQREICARSTPFFAPATILCQLPLRPLECSGLRLHHFLESWGGGLELRPGSLGHYSSCGRELRWQCSEAMRLQYWAQHPPQTMCMFKFSCRDNSAINTVIIIVIIIFTISHHHVTVCSKIRQ